MNNTYQVVKTFEKRIAKFCGSKYAVSVDSCSNAILLACEYENVRQYSDIVIPSRTYPSVPCSIIHAGGRVKFEDVKWKGAYKLQPTNIVDSAKRFHKGCYEKGTLTCLSFHVKKFLPIGRGGMILTDDLDAVHWLMCARFDGRHECPLETDNLRVIGHNCYMLPEQAARGMMLMDFIETHDLSDLEEEPYQDLSKYEMYTTANRPMPSGI